MGRVLTERNKMATKCFRAKIKANPNDLSLLSAMLELLVHPPQEASVTLEAETWRAGF